MVLMVELSSASISFSKSSPLDDSLSPVRYSLISFFFWSGVPFSSTSSSSSELTRVEQGRNHLKPLNNFFLGGGVILGSIFLISPNEITSSLNDLVL